MKKIFIKISADFSEHTGARYRTDGPFSGEEFFEDILKPKIDLVWNDKKCKLLLDLDGTFGYASSFISEVFTRVVKEYKDKTKIRNKLEIKSQDDPLLIKSVDKIIDEA